MMDFKSKYAQVRAARQHALAEYTAAAKRQREEERKKYADALQGLRKRVAACISAAKPHMGCCDYRVSLDMVEGNSTRPVGALTVIIQELRDAGFTCHIRWELDHDDADHPHAASPWLRIEW